MSRTVAKAQRLNLLRDELQRRPRSVVELARSHGTSRRTIERDLSALAGAMGEDLRKDGSHRWYIPQRSVALNEVEALAVYSATRLLLHTGVGERHYRAALEKLAQQVPEPARTSLLHGVDKLAAAPEDRVLDLVAQAWFQGRVLHCDYASAHSGETTPRELEVYFYELNRRNLEPYVLAFDRNYRKRVLVFKLARMNNVRLLDAHYDIPEDFDPGRELEAAFGIVIGDEVEIVLRVPKAVAKRMAEGADRSLRVGDGHSDGRSDGHSLVHVVGTLDNRGNALELLPWLLSWGSAIEVLSPESVRVAVGKELRRAAASYDSSIDASNGAAEPA